MGINFDEEMKDMISLRSVMFTRCADVKFRVWKGIKFVRNVIFFDCEELSNVEELVGLRDLKSVEFNGCDCVDMNVFNKLNVHTIRVRQNSSVKDLSMLIGLKSLMYVDFIDCVNLKNVDDLVSVGALVTVNLSGCVGLENVDVLLGCTRLRCLYLGGSGVFSFGGGGGRNEKVGNIDVVWEYKN